MDFDLAGLEVDHRKRSAYPSPTPPPPSPTHPLLSRRRNRTTQSCLNCHTSKRKVRVQCIRPHRSVHLRSALIHLFSPVRQEATLPALYTTGAGAIAFLIHPNFVLTPTPDRPLCVRGGRPRPAVRRVSLGLRARLAIHVCSSPTPGMIRTSTRTRACGTVSPS